MAHLFPHRPIISRAKPCASCSFTCPPPGSPCLSIQSWHWPAPWPSSSAIPSQTLPQNQQHPSAPSFVFSLLPPVPSGASPCGAPGGCGTRGSPPCSCSFFSMWVTSPSGRPLKNRHAPDDCPHRGPCWFHQHPHHQVFRRLVEHP